MEFSFFPFLAPTVYGSSNNYLIRSPIWPLYTPTPYKVYFQQTPALPSQIDVTTRVEADFRCGTPQLRSGRERLLLCQAGLHHAQQEEVTEERDLRPNSQEAS